MKMTIVLFILIMGTMSICSQASANTFVPNTDIINVKDFGAKGDGHTDDTKAIEAAIAAAMNGRSSTMQINPGNNTTIYFGGAKKIYFPYGTYCINHTLSFGSYLNIEADQAILKPTPDFSSPSNFALSGNGWQTEIEGLQFIGFSKALQINNQNADAGRVIIRGCDFIHDGVAISLTAQSSISIIKGCRFYKNKKVLLQTGDKVIFRNNWITSGALSGNHDAQIVVYGTLNFEDNLLVPIPPTPDANEPAWINNYGSVWASGIRQGAESGSFTLINNFAEATSSFLNGSTVVSVQNSTCYAEYDTTPDNPQPAAIRLFYIPNQIILENLSGLVHASLLAFSQSAATNAPVSLNDRNCSIRINNIVGNYNLPSGNWIPNSLKKFIVK